MKFLTRLPGFPRWIYFLVVAWSGLISGPSGTVLGALSPTEITAVNTTSPENARSFATNALGTRDGAETTVQRVDISTEFSLIPAGIFAMGDALDGEVDTPVRQVTVSAFYMAKHETTQAMWEEVRAWGLSNGYTDLPVGGGIGPHHPVQEISWFDAIKWCNARSE